MVGKTMALCAAALTQFQSALAVPMGQHDLVLPVLKRENITVTPPKDITPNITVIDSLTEEQLKELIEEVESGFSNFVSRTVDLPAAPVQLAARAQATEGALLTFIDGEALPGSGSTCEAFELNGPFSSFHAYMGSGNFRGIAGASLSGNESTVQASTETLVDAGAFTLEQNERITVFSVGRLTGPNIAAIRLETDLGNTYEAQSSNIVDGKGTPTWEDLNVGSGVLARIRGTTCSDIGIMGSIGFDFIDVLDSVSISNIDYEGFTNNIMPTGPGTQLSVGSQILDNRNSSEKQTITLTTTDAITRQQLVSTDSWFTVGGKVGVETTVKVPFVSDTKVSTEASWSLQENEVRFASLLHPKPMGDPNFPSSSC